MATNVSARMADDARSPGRVADLIRWGPVFAGVIIALAFFALMNTLWLAIAYSAGDGWISGNLGWFIAPTAAVALMLAGLLAGLFAGPRGKAAGITNGVAAWGLLFVLSLTALVPSAVNLTTQLGVGLREGNTTVGGALGTDGGGFTIETALWVSFWSLLAGLLLAALGGLLGGKMRRPVVSAETASRDQRPTTVTENYVVDREPVDRTPEATTTEIRPELRTEATHRS
ncbi:hypothetical protein FHU33_2029 [Blastococcus colisei]|uniref:Uncharacterized protein n=1 Tax=Blastococcus colisei TaxID=1564162 RepID=A0A543PEX0_9ACTN|nr:hypothetical protein [Blastococcus colisei]TQN42623.1 hypothetical protein FHU33_2029 [Blastococcus colisei]